VKSSIAFLKPIVFPYRTCSTQRLHTTRYAVTSNPADLAAFQAELTRQANDFSDPHLRAVFVAWAGGKSAH